MRLKSYFAASVEAAMKLAKKELGDDAMLVHSRRASAEAHQLGEYEVVFAVPGSLQKRIEEAPAKPKTAPAPYEEAAPRPTAWEKFSSEIADLRDQVQKVAMNLERQNARSANPEMYEALHSLQEGLLRQDVYASLAEPLTTLLREGLGGEFDPSAPAGFLAAASTRLRDEMTKALPRFSFDFDAAGSRKVIAFVGPPGAGKTTTLVKLAARYGLLGRRRTHILSVDNVRIAAGDQLRCYAAILSMGFDSLESGFALRQALVEHAAKQIILIDTPGLAGGDPAAARELASILRGIPDINVLLVLRASMRSADLSRVTDRFRAFQPSGMVFTGLDETEHLGQIWSEAVRTGIPVSFLSSGQQIPEDLEEGSATRILEPIFRSLTVPAIERIPRTPVTLNWGAGAGEQALAVA